MKPKTKRTKRKYITSQRKLEAMIKRLARKRKIDTSDIPVVKDWSKAVRGKYYRKTKQKVKPRRKRVPKVAAPAIMLGSLGFKSYLEMLATADQIIAQVKTFVNDHEAYKDYEHGRYVKVEGWQMLGSLIGVVAIEQDSAKRFVYDGVEGYEAKVRLARWNDMKNTIGRGTAECSRAERDWVKADSHAIRSMAITRATSKAFRLSYSWLMVRAGFQPTPAEEMIDERKLVRDTPPTPPMPEPEPPVPAPQGKANGQARGKLFIVYPESHNGHFGVLYPKAEIDALLIEPYLVEQCGGKWSDRLGGFLIPSENMETVKLIIQDKGKTVFEAKYNGG